MEDIKAAKQKSDNEKDKKAKVEKDPLVLEEITLNDTTFEIFKTRGIGHCSIDAMFGDQVNRNRAIYLKDALK
jgi:hypothetical protein